MRTKITAGGLGLLATAAMALGASPALAASPAIEVLSNRADLISAGDALVAVDLPEGTDASAVRVTAGDRDVTDQFAMRANGRYEGLVTGLPVGPTVLTAHVPGAGDPQITIFDHPNGGPVFSGPQVQPWVCQSGATDKQCNQPVSYAYQYRSTQSGQFAAYDPAKPPSDVATTTTDQGKKVPYIVRVETGYQDRDQYAIAVLYDPSKPFTAWAPQDGFNHKLLIEHGASCGIDHKTGSAPSVLDDAGLSRGFAVMSTALDNAGHNCNIATEAESLVMAKERVVEQYGTLRYTIGTGCSGGSLVQQQVANAYPGVYQGILPQCSFPDSWSTGQQLVDYHLVRGYVEHPERWATGVAWDPLSIAAVEGHPNHVNSIILDSLYWTALGDPTNACAGVSATERYSATNPKGVRCTLADYEASVMGIRPQDGFAGRPLDNVGVQYGLEALHKGQITAQQFVDLNAKIGGGDIDSNFTPQRTVADEPALANSYRSGGVNETNNLDQIAIIDLRGTDPGAFHDVYRAFAVRDRLEREHGTFANQVIWQGVVPLLGDVNYTTQGLVAIDRWLAAVEADKGDGSLAQKIAADKPTDVHDQCTDGAGQVIPDQKTCQLINPVFTTPRMVAGENVVTDIQKCRLTPLRRADYTPVYFTDDEWGQLVKAFPDGVCDFSKLGVSQQGAIPWQTYQDDGLDGKVIYGGVPLGAPPAGSGGGLAEPVFATRVER